MTKLFYYRKLAQLKQRDMAKILNITTQNYSQKETGKRPFKAKEMTTIRDYLSNKIDNYLTIDELFF